MAKFSNRVDTRFAYVPAAESAKPGYLARRFATIRKQQAEAAAKLKAEDEAISVEQSVKLRMLRK